MEQTYVFHSQSGYTRYGFDAYTSTIKIDKEIVRAYINKEYKSNSTYSPFNGTKQKFRSVEIKKQDIVSAKLGIRVMMNIFGILGNLILIIGMVALYYKVEEFSLFMGIGMILLLETFLLLNISMRVIVIKTVDNLKYYIPIKQGFGDWFKKDEKKNLNQVLFQIIYQYGSKKQKTL